MPIQYHDSEQVCSVEINRSLYSTFTQNIYSDNIQFLFLVFTYLIILINYACLLHPLLLLFFFFFFSLYIYYFEKKHVLQKSSYSIGGLYLVSCGATVTRLPLHTNTDSSTASPIQNIAVSGSQMSVGNKLQSLCDLASFEHFKRLHLSKHSSNENILPSTTPSTPK